MASQHAKHLQIGEIFYDGDEGIFRVSDSQLGWKTVEVDQDPSSSAIERIEPIIIDADDVESAIWHPRMAALQIWLRPDSQENVNPYKRGFYGYSGTTTRKPVCFYNFSREAVEDVAGAFADWIGVEIRDGGAGGGGVLGTRWREGVGGSWCGARVGGPFFGENVVFGGVWGVDFEEFLQRAQGGSP